MKNYKKNLTILLTSLVLMFTSGLALSADKVIKIGYISPQTGPLAGFGEADDYVLDEVREQLKNGIQIGGDQWQVEIIAKDSQSSSNRASELAAELILRDEVHMILVGGTPDTTNPVSDQCEVNEIPCISTVAPWQPWFLGRGGNPEVGFDYTYHFFWGLEDVIGNYTALWDEVNQNGNVGGLFPNDGDGNAWGDKTVGFPPVLEQKGMSLTDPGRYQNMNDDFSSYINAFKNNDVEIITGVMIPPDFTTFWTQAIQQGFKPKVASIGKAILFPSALEALGDNGHNLSSEIWWSPNHPFQSSLNGMSAKQLADGYSTATSKQWTQPIGFVHALFEVAVDVLERSDDPSNPTSITKAIQETDLDTIVGNINWSKGPVKNVAKTPLVAGQWRLVNDKYKYDLVITYNGMAPEIPLTGKTEAID
jgi:branched-chain amino acid transport system substrate-binding protein|tara:strand:- start:6180 stop:7442 length:1263 start_codon:yes stop_codon:yes gene_type:complete